MGVLQALQRTPGALKRAPGLVVPQLLVFVLLLPQLLLQSAYPLVSALYSLGSSAVLLLGMPFIQGGMFGMADEALTTRSSLSRFLSDGKSNYLQLLIAYVLLLVVNGVIGALGVAAGFGAFLTHDAVRMVFVGLVAVAVLVYLFVAFFVQFYGQAIVINGASAIASSNGVIALSVRTSWRQLAIRCSRWSLALSAVASTLASRYLRVPKLRRFLACRRYRCLF